MSDKCAHGLEIEDVIQVILLFQISQFTGTNYCNIAIIISHRYYISILLYPRCRYDMILKYLCNKERQGAKSTIFIVEVLIFLLTLRLCRNKCYNRL